MINMILDDASDRMQKAIEAYQRDLATVRTGRATPAMLDRVMVNYYGSPTPINQMAGVSVVEGRQLVIKPFDKSALKNEHLYKQNYSKGKIHIFTLKSVLMIFSKLESKQYDILSSANKIHLRTCFHKKLPPGFWLYLFRKENQRLH